MKKKKFIVVDDNLYFLLLTTFHRRGNLVLESESRGEENLTPRFGRSMGQGDFNAVVNLFLNRPLQIISVQKQYNRSRR